MPKIVCLILLVILSYTSSVFAQENDNFKGKSTSSGGVVTFRVVDDDATEIFNSYYTANPSSTFNENGTLIDTAIIPADTEIFGLYGKDEYDIEERVGYLVVKKDSVLNNDHIASVEIFDEHLDQPQVIFVLDAEGTELFAEFTGSNLGKSLTIVLDNKILLYAKIYESITDGKIAVSGLSLEEVQDIQRALHKTWDTSSEFKK